MTEKTNEETLVSEYSELESRLAQWEPYLRPGAREETKRLGLAEMTWGNATSLSDIELAEAIVRRGEPEIVLSLKQYLRTVQTNAVLVGLAIGFAAGVAFAFCLERDRPVKTENARTETQWIVPATGQLNSGDYHDFEK